MHTPLTRRQMLRLAVLGGFGGALAACAAPAAQDPSPVSAPAAPTIAPMIAPTVAPTIAPTVAPALTAVPVAAAPTAAAPAPTAQPTASPSAALAASMAQAASQLLGALDGERRARASYAFADAERVRWHWTAPSGFPRNGLPLSEMAQPQRDLALALLSAGHSPAGYQKALAIMALQSELGSNPELYYVTIFGEPGGAAPWGWRWEGHHYSRHFTIVGDQVTMTPFFLGAWPTTTNAGLQAMPREENAARELVSALSGPARDQAIFQTRALTQHLTQNQPLVSPLEPVGISYAQLDPAQQGLVDELITSYLSTLPDPMSQPIWGRIRAAGMGEIRFGWAGPIEPRRPAYYRLQGPTFLLEFDNSRNGGTHIHSVWRDFDQDFGRQIAA